MTTESIPALKPAPLLTLAIPTYNRAQYLEELLAVLEPQAAAFPCVEVLICDNASSDGTPDVTAAAAERFALAGASMRVLRHATNIGSVANFVACFREARGRFFWMCGDDDVPVPGSLAQVVPLIENTPELDMIYATSYSFRENFVNERQVDPLGRILHTITDARQFAMTVNIMFTFISGMIVNRERVLAMGAEPPEDFLDTNLVQLAWSLPLLREHRRSIVLWTRPVAARVGNAQGYSIGKVFGEKLAGNVRRLLPGRTDLQDAILNFALRRWFPSILLDVRAQGNKSLKLEEAQSALRQTYGGNLRYWVFTYPAVAWPLPVARLYTKGTAAVSKLLYMAHLPGFWRKRT